MEAFCVKCKKKVEVKDIEDVLMKNGRPATKSKCAVCNTNVFKIGARKTDEA